MDATGEKLNIEDERSWAGSRVTRRILPEDHSNFTPAQSWHDRRRPKVLGMGRALPGPPVSTSELLMRLEERFGIAVLRQGTALSHRLKIRARYLTVIFKRGARRRAADIQIRIWPRPRFAGHWRMPGSKSAISPILSGIRPAPPACCRPTSPSSLTVSALPARTWSCVKPVLALPMR